MDLSHNEVKNKDDLEKFRNVWEIKMILKTNIQNIKQKLGYTLENKVDLEKTQRGYCRSVNMSTPLCMTVDLDKIQIALVFNDGR